MFRRVARQTSAKIRAVTELSTEHMTPEFEFGVHHSFDFAFIVSKQFLKRLSNTHAKLLLVTRQCEFYHSQPDKFPFPDPYWAFYWPGGQALTRFILDSNRTYGKTLDFGLGNLHFV